MTSHEIEWLRAWAAAFGAFPRRYLCFDIETTGFNNDDLILQIGWCEVVDGKVVENDGMILDWVHHPGTDHNWLQGRIDAVRESMQKSGQQYPWSLERVATGHPPLAVLDEFLRILRRPTPPFFVSHNGWQFDEPKLCIAFKRFLKDGYAFPVDRNWDTGVMEKGRQMGELPLPNEPAKIFGKRIMGARCRIKWSLLNYCVPQHGLAEKHNLQLDGAHTAIFDALVTHHLLEHYAQMTTQAGACFLPVPELTSTGVAP